MPEQIVRPALILTREVKDLIKFISWTEENLWEAIEESLVLSDANEYAARKIVVSEHLTFVVFKEGSEQVRVFADPDWLNSVEMHQVREQISWGTS